MKIKKLIALGLISASVVAASFSVYANEVTSETETETPTYQRGFRGGAAGDVQRGYGCGFQFSEEDYAELYEKHAEIYAEVAGITVDEAKALTDDMRDFRILADENGLTDEYFEAMQEFMLEYREENGLPSQGGFKGGMRGGSRGGRGCRGFNQTNEL